MEATQGMADFCRLLNLPIDAAKSFAWSTSSSGRKHIQEAGIICKLYSRGLGGYMNFIRLTTNSTVQDKIAVCSRFWSKLAKSCAPISHKERALYVVAWPNMFYGVPTVTLGNNHFVKL